MNTQSPARVPGPTGPGDASRGGSTPPAVPLTPADAGPVAHPASRTVVTALVEAGLLDPARTAEADPVVASALARSAPLSGPPGPSAAAAPLRRRMAEVAGYVGGALVVGAAVLFFANAWDDLGLAGRVGVLLGIGVLLLGAGAAVTATAGGAGALRAPAESVRRRLASVLLTGGAAAAAFGVAVWLQEVLATESAGVAGGALVAVALTLAGYRVAASAVGQVGAATAAFLAVPSGLDWLVQEWSEALFGSIVLGLGLLWLVLAETGVWRERVPARAIGLVLAVLGGQIPAFGDATAWAYSLTGAVAVLAFAGYLARRSWPYLAAGVVGLTLAVPEALFDLTGESLGAAGVLLATGLTLLLAALLGLRLHQEVREPKA